MKIKKGNSLSNKEIELKKYIELASECVYALFSNVSVDTKLYKNVIFLPFFGHLGDMVMFMDVFDEYKRLYIEQKHYEFVLGCRKEVWQLLDTLERTRGINYVEINREKFDDIKYFVDRVKVIKAYKPELIINVRENNAIENVFLHAIPAKEKYTYRSYRIQYTNIIGRFFSRNTYSTIWTDNDEKDQISCYADMLCKLGIKGYKSKLVRLPKIKALIKNIPEKYIAICPGASVENKCWPVERFVSVTNYLYEKTGIPIVLCGGNSDTIISEKIKNKCKYQNYVYDITGKTTINEWIYVLQNALFVFTNESGSIHIAAASAVPSICIGEQKYSNKWLPYRLEEIREDDVFPIVVRGKKLKCDFCASRSFAFTKSCKDCFNKNGVVECVYSVTESMIFEAIDKYVLDFINLQRNRYEFTKQGNK